jgi:hypothetical protein
MLLNPCRSQRLSQQHRQYLQSNKARFDGTASYSHGSAWVLSRFVYPAADLKYSRSFGEILHACRFIPRLWPLLRGQLAMSILIARPSTSDPTLVSSTIAVYFKHITLLLSSTLLLAVLVHLLRQRPPLRLDLVEDVADPFLADAVPPGFDHLREHRL